MDDAAVDVMGDGAAVVTVVMGEHAAAGVVNEAVVGRSASVLVLWREPAAAAMAAA